MGVNAFWSNPNLPIQPPTQLEVKKRWFPENPKIGFKGPWTLLRSFLRGQLVGLNLPKLNPFFLKSSS